MMTLKMIRLASWASLAAIIFVTVSPIGLRPQDVMPVNIDRALAFAVTAALFVIAYPRHVVLVTVLLIASAGIIEAMQLLSPSRHAHFEDAAVKALGAAIGASVGWAVTQVIRARQAKAR